MIFPLYYNFTTLNFSCFLVIFVQTRVLFHFHPSFFFHLHPRFLTLIAIDMIVCE